MQLSKQEKVKVSASGVTEDSERICGNGQISRHTFWCSLKEASPAHQNTLEKQFSPTLSHTSSLVHYGCCGNNPVNKIAYSVNLAPRWLAQHPDLKK